MNDFGENSDWENLVALSDDELEAALAEQKRHSHVKTANDPDKNIKNINLVDLNEVTLDIPQSTLQPNGGFNFDQIDMNWDYLIEQESTPENSGKSTNKNTEYPNWEQVNGTEPRSQATQDWETTSDDISSKVSESTNNAMTEGWEKASDEVNTEFMKEWEESAAKISEHPTPNLNIDPDLNIDMEDVDYLDWEQAIASTDINTDNNLEAVIPDWEIDNNIPPEPNYMMIEGWEKASDEVNTEFMKEWEESAARISALTGIDLSEGDSLENIPPEKALVNGFNPAPARHDRNLEKINSEKIKPEKINLEKPNLEKPNLNHLPPTVSDESGPLPPLPVLQPKKRQPKKSTTAPDLDWFEKYHDRSQDSLGEIPDKIPPEPNSAYHFDRLAEEICENDQFSWTSLNQKAQSQPASPTPRVWNPDGKILIDLGEEEQVESTAVWNYNPPKSFTEAETGASESGKPRLDLKLSLTQLWQKFKVPIAAIAVLGGLFAIYSMPFVNRAVTETGLKWQLFKDASYKDLAGINFQAAKLEKVNFSNTNLQNANFKKANLAGASLNGANLKGANLIGANLRAVDLKNSKIELKGEQATKLDPSDLLMWRIINRPLAGRNLSRQNLDGFFLSTANLKKANLSEAKLAWVNFVNADLADANLSGADLTGTNFSGADLKGANLDGAKWAKFAPKTSSTTTCINGKQGPCKF